MATTPRATAFVIFFAVFTMVPLAMAGATNLDGIEGVYSRLKTPLEPSERKTPRFNECAANEAEYLKIQRSVLLPWRDAWIRKDATAFEALADRALETSDFSLQAAKPWRSRGGIDE